MTIDTIHSNLVTETEVVEQMQESGDVIKGLAQTASEIVHAANLIAGRLRSGGKLIVFGNGGRAAGAQHLAAELVGRYCLDRAPLAAIALTTDSSSLTAVGNDYGFDQIFSRQLEAVGKTADVALAISTSGNSANVLHAIDSARRLGMLTIGLTGCHGGQLRDRVDLCLCVPSDSTPRIQEAHTLVIHVLAGIVEKGFVNAALDLARSAIQQTP